MQWTDQGYLLSKTNFDENSIIIETFTLEHGKFTGIVYGGASRKNKKNFQIGNKLSLNWKSKNQNKSGYFSTELIKPIIPSYFHDKKRCICILSAVSILKILLPERQVNEKIYNSFELMIDKIKSKNWIQFYIFWELSLIKELGYEIDFLKDYQKKNNLNIYIKINEKDFKVPEMILKRKMHKDEKNVKEALAFNKNLLLENFIFPNKIKLPLFRKILEMYYS
jgi:DNA repair protein RecO (recombination protein O)